jgi:UDP-2,3-diacylglucosamine pyrophosphatase LpxH
VVCGHIHQPEMREVKNDHGKIMYLNSGDWIENLTALEYVNSEWKIYRFDDTAIEQMKAEAIEEEELDNSTLFDNMVEEFNLMRN